MNQPTPTVVALAVGLALAIQGVAAAVKTSADFDKAFDFTQAKTWGWNPKGAGDVIMARTPEDDAATVKPRAEPIILSAVAAEMPKRGLTLATATPDLVLTYYLLLTVNMSRQTMGQFLPPVAAWGIPPFAPATTAINAMEQGSLVLDLSAKGQVVWRGLGEAEINWTLNDNQRTALLREAVQKILERYPPKK